MKQGCKTILMLFLGIFLGFLLTLGGLALGGYWAYQNLTLNKVEEIVGNDIVDLGKYNNKPIKDLIMEISNITNMTIQEIDENFLDNAIKSNLTVNLNGKEIDLTKNIFKDVFNSKVSNVTDKIGNLKENITFGFIYEDILLESDIQIPENSPLLEKYKNISLETALSKIGDEKILSLVNEGHQFENQMLNTVFNAIKNLSINELSDNNKLETALNSMKINNLLELNSTSTGVLKALYLEDLTLGELKQNDSFDELAINEILELDSNSTGVLGAIQEKNWKLADLKNTTNFGSLNVGKILNISNSATGFLGAIRNWNLNHITNENLNNLSLGTILNIDASQKGILGTIKEWKLNELNNTKFLNLNIQTILEIPDNAQGILGKIKTWKLNEITNEKFNELFSTITIGELVAGACLEIQDYESKKNTMIGTKTLENTTLREFINYAISNL